MADSALVVGVSGIVGNNLARHLRERGWQVHGLARRPSTDIDGVTPVAERKLVANCCELPKPAANATSVMASSVSINLRLASSMRNRSTKR